MTEEQVNYKDTINLPVTDFPMKADLPKREPLILEKWEKDDLYAQIRRQSKGKERFVLHDGPPFANGDIHLGHTLNKVLKDIIVKYRTMAGFDSPYVPGWDCHGLPIEHKVSQDLKEKSADAVLVRTHSAAYARKYIEIQKGQFKRLGVLGDWENPYLTMNPAYEAEILRLFAGLVEKDLVYQALRPVFWCSDCKTALAEAEVEYNDRQDTSVYVKFKVESGPKAPAGSANLLIWTTTPWTLPANLAVAVHPDMQYVWAKRDGESYLVAESRLADFERIAKTKAESSAPIRGKDLEGLGYEHPFLKDGHKRRVILGDFVTAETGTGLVHIAPGHGHDDYVAGQKNKLAILSPVDGRGCLTAEAGLAEITGQYVFKANPLIVEILRKSGHLLADENYQHSYPYCWRSKTPIIFRSVKQWFIKVDAFRKEALHAIDSVEWIPDWGKNRIRSSVELRHDWCISRQRTWGVPIPVFFDASDKPHLDAGVVRRFADLAEKEGTDAWFNTPEAELAKKLNVPAGFKKGADTLDVWIDSGSSWKAVVEKLFRLPAELYLEGSDQHRGWFQSSLLMSCAITGEAPYRAVLTHGFVVDGEGKKMSKSLGNVVSPQDVIKTLGADVLRLWVASSLYADDIRVSKDIFDRLSDSYRKFRNTFKYLLGNLHGFDPKKDALPLNQMQEVDRWALSKLAAIIDESTRAFDAYQYHRFYQSIYNFCVRDLSSFYFDVLKDRLYTDARRSASGRSCRTALFEIMTALARLLAPVLAFTAEEAWAHLAPFEGKKDSIHLEAWPEARREWRDAELEAKWERLLKPRDMVMKKLEEKREKKEIGNSLEAEVELSIPDAGEFEFFSGSAALLAPVFLVSQVSVKRGEGAGILAAVSRAKGLKCARCWNYRPEVGKDPGFAGLCGRCIDAVKG